MGASQSDDSQDYMSFMAQLSLKDYKNDDGYWTKLITKAPPRAQIPLPYARLMNEIAIKYPQNFLRLVLICVHTISLFESGDSQSIFPDMILDQFILSQAIILACFETLIYNEKLIALLNKLDTSFAEAYLTARPQLIHILEQSTQSTHTNSEIPKTKPENQNETTQPTEKFDRNENNEAQNETTQPTETNQDKNDKNEKIETNQSIKNSQKVATISPLVSSMKLHEGHVISTLSKIFIKCLYKNGLSLSKEQWCQDSPDHVQFNQMRKFIVHFIYFLNSVDYNLPDQMDPKPTFPIYFDDFPYSTFIESVCLVSHKFLLNQYNKTIEQDTSDLLLNCFGLFTKFYDKEEFQNALTLINAEILLQALVLLEFPQQPPIFQSGGALSTESMIFLYHCLLYQPDLISLISSHNLSLTFIHHLLQKGQTDFNNKTLENQYQIIVSIIILLISNEQCAQSLNDPPLFNFTKSFLTYYLIGDSSSSADLMIEVFSTICDPVYLGCVISSILHLLSPIITAFSINSVEKCFSIFQSALKNGDVKVIQSFVEAFAEMVQKRNNSNNIFLIYIYQNAQLFEELKQNNVEIENSSLERVLKYIEFVKNENKDINFVLAEMNSEVLFPTVVSFTKHADVFGTQMKETLIQSAKKIYQRAFEIELQRMNSMKMELKIYEAQALTKASSQNQIEEFESESDH